VVPFIRSKTSSALIVVCAAVVVSLSSLAGTLQLTRTLIQRERLQWQHRTDAETFHIAEQLRHGLADRFDALRRVGIWWQSQGRPLDSRDWETDLRMFFESAGGLQRLIWVDAAGKRSWSGSENVVPGERAFEPVPSELKQILGVVGRKKSLAISRVVDQPDGRRVVYACVPLQDRGGLSGYIAGLYDATELLESVLRHQVPHDYQVEVIAGGRELKLFHAPEGQGPAIDQTAPVRLPNATWQVRVRATLGDLKSLRRMVMTFGVVISLLLWISTFMGGIAYRRTVALKQEIRERRAAEQKVALLNRDLQHRLSDFQALLDVTPIGIAVTYDPECRNIWINPALAAMLGVSQAQNISKSGPDAGKLRFQVLRDGRILAPDELPMQVAGRTGKDVPGEELDLVREDGGVIHTLAYTAPLFDEERKVRGVLHVSVDITHRKQAEQERNMLAHKLLRAEKFKSLALMAGGLAHDLNNLLTSVIGNEHLALEELPRQSPARELILHSLAASQKAAALMQQLMRYTGRTFYTPKPLDLSCVIAESRDVLQAVIPPGVELVFELSGNLPLIGAGLLEIQQVLQNLVTNAVDALGEGPGRILITTAPCEVSEETIDAFYSEQEIAPGRYVQLAVADNGCGMPLDTATKAFDPFFTTKFLGRGLGLSEVQGVLRAHGGAVRVESSPASGSKFILLFPALSTETAAAATAR
jgi:PAS domain S-box-containing protein